MTDEIEITYKYILGLRVSSELFLKFFSWLAALKPQDKSLILLLLQRNINLAAVRVAKQALLGALKRQKVKGALYIWILREHFPATIFESLDWSSSKADSARSKSKKASVCQEEKLRRKSKQEECAQSIKWDIRRSVDEEERRVPDKHL